MKTPRIMANRFHGHPASLFLAASLAARIATSAFLLAGTDKPVSFRADIAPILVAKCQVCHGDKTAKGN